MPINLICRDHIPKISGEVLDMPITPQKIKPLSTDNLVRLQLPRQPWMLLRFDGSQHSVRYESEDVRLAYIAFERDAVDAEEVP